MADDREVTCGGYPARCGLQCGDPAKMGGDAYRSAAVAANAACRAERCNGSRFAAARSAGRALEVPWIVGAAGDVIIGFVIGKRFRAVGFAQNDGARRAQPGDRGRVLRRSMAQAKLAAAECGEAGHVEAVFDSYGHAM